MLAWRYGSATHFQFIPDASWDNLNFWSQIALAMTGLELAPILGGEILNPGRNIPRAAWISGFGCATFYMAGTAAMLALLPPEKISAMTGLAQAGDVAGARFGAHWLSPCFALLITVGVVGQLSTYIAGNSRLPFAIGLDNYLPKAFARLHPRWHTPHVSILTQGVLSSIFLLLSEMGENLRAAYQILVDMVVIATLIPFVYIFATGFKFGQRAAGVAGALIAGAAVILAAIPPPGVASVWMFELKVIGGTVLLALAGRVIFLRSKAAAG
jgi:amino acid transporter